MSGILEQILAELKSINASLSNGGGTVSSPNSTPQSSPNTGTGGTVQNNATTTGGASAASTVTSDTLLQLVQPMVQDESLKAKVKEVLTKHGLNRLGEAQESQYAALYADFVAIRDGGASSNNQELI